MFTLYTRVVPDKSTPKICTENLHAVRRRDGNRQNKRLRRYRRRVHSLANYVAERFAFEERKSDFIVQYNYNSEIGTRATREPRMSAQAA